MANIPESFAAGDVAGTTFNVQRAYQEKLAWQFDRAVQGNLVANILRYTSAGGDASAGIDPTYTLVALLANIPVAKYGDRKAIERKWGSLCHGGEQEFKFYPVVAGQPPEVLAEDIVRFGSDDYRVVSVDYDPQTDRCSILARLDRDAG